MPEISRFFGIVIHMFAETGGRHHRPHFHASDQENSAVYAIGDLTCLAGNLPKKQHRLVQAWGEIHRGELENDWRLLLEGRIPVRIAPLR